MSILLDHRISTEFFRRLYAIDRAPRYSVDKPGEDGLVFSEEDAWAFAPSWITPQFLSQNLDYLGVLTFEPNCRRRSKTHASHVWTGPVPKGSFNDLLTGAYLCSPEFCFLQAALGLSLIELIAFGDELCGCYSFDERSERGMRKRETPLTSKRKIANYLDGAKGCRGYKRANQALQFMVDGSASPMETLDEMCLCLPYRYGGYGIAAPDINLEILLDGRAARIAGQSFARLDMYWREPNFDLEHQGAYDHAGTANYYRDRARINALKEMGLEVYELTAKQVGSLEAFEAVALRVADLLGKRLRPEKLGATHERIELRRVLRAWNASYGKLP